VLWREHWVSRRTGQSWVVIECDRWRLEGVEGLTGMDRLVGNALCRWWERVTIVDSEVVHRKASVQGVESREDLARRGFFAGILWHARVSDASHHDTSCLLARGFHGPQKLRRLHTTVAFTMKF
jgi:hypothetical protein